MKASKFTVTLFLAGLVFVSCFVLSSFSANFVQAGDDAAESPGLHKIVRAETLPVNGTPLPDTGQTKCYNNTEEIPCPNPGEDFYGQDGSYLINPPSYTKLDANGNDLPADAAEWVMVRDNVTQLIWEVKTDSDDGSIHDKDDEYDWYDAQDVFVAALNAEKFGGYSDWRMPNIKELASIEDLRRYGPAIDTDFFPNTVSSDYWSSTTDPYYTDTAWYIYFSHGDDNRGYKGYSSYVRAVRGGQSRSLDHFVINGDGTVTDTVTGLMWQQTTPGKKSWEGAIRYCEGLTLAEHDNWRLPHRRELRSIADYSRCGPAIDTDFFPNTLSSDYYWSSTTSAYSSYCPWVVHFYYGYGSRYFKDSHSYSYVRAVRGGQSQL